MESPDQPVRMMRERMLGWPCIRLTGADVFVLVTMMAGDLVAVIAINAGVTAVLKSTSGRRPGAAGVLIAMASSNAEVVASLDRRVVDRIHAIGNDRGRRDKRDEKDGKIHEEAGELHLGGFPRLNALQGLDEAR